MKKKFLSVLAVVSLILTIGSWRPSQAQNCPEDLGDFGECDTLAVICLDCEQSPGSGRYLVRLPFYSGFVRSSDLTHCQE